MATIYCALTMQAKSEYFESLSGDVLVRYEAKVLTVGLTKYPYCITEWVEEPTVIPDIKWSDSMLYMVSTPSPYTKEEVKYVVLLFIVNCFTLLVQAWKGMFDGEFLKAD